MTNDTKPEWPEHYPNGEPVLPAPSGWDEIGGWSAWTEAQVLAYGEARAQAALTQARAVPSGWKLVPVEPTEAMRRAGREYAECAISANAVFCFRAMLSASPPPPTEQSEQARPGGISARACEWDQDSSAQWTDRYYGFSIIEEQGDELPFSAAWGEDDGEQFATLEEAKAWCQSQVDGWIAKYAVLPGQQSEQARQPLTDAAVCPWCDRQGHDICQHADDARTCHQ